MRVSLLPDSQVGPQGPAPERDLQALLRRAYLPSASMLLMQRG